MHFFDDLDEAVEILSDYVAERPTAGEFAKFDLLLDGSYAAWLRFANSLRMRLAVRLASVAPEKARAEFRKAAADPYGVIEVNTNNAAVKTSGIYSNPLGRHERFDGVRADGFRRPAYREVFRTLRRGSRYCE